jgi:hypothetical protein
MASGRDDVRRFLDDTNGADPKFARPNQRDLLISLGMTIHIYLTILIMSERTRLIKRLFLKLALARLKITVAFSPRVCMLSILTKTRN